MIDNDRDALTQAMTPMIAMTPGMGLGGSTYDRMSAAATPAGVGMTPGSMTPGMQSPGMACFTPNMMAADGNYASPGVASPSPFYASPAYG